MEEKKYQGKITAVSSKNKANGSIGFLIEGIDSWFNINAAEDALDILLKVTIVKGNKIEFLMGQNGIENLKILEAVKSGDKSWAEDMTNFEDLLTAAHKKGLIAINTELVQIDPLKKFAVFKATVEGWIGDEKKAEEGVNGKFTGYGDAEGITNDKIQPHWIRMAETRAIVRALRWYTNNATVAEEETGE
jgi:hypothetical protein